MVALAMTSSLAGLNLWSLWLSSSDRQPPVRGSRPRGLLSPSWWRRWSGAPGWTRRTRYPASWGVPSNLLSALATTFTAVLAGCWIDVLRLSRCMKSRSDVRSDGGTGSLKESG